MRPLDIFRWLADSQRDLGSLLRFETLVPFTLLIFAVGGSVLTLPPGPLCDEGMVLFMEGGCDWGLSNIFFFAKLSLLVTANLAVLNAWKRPPVSWHGLLPHFVLLGLMVYINRGGESCDTYYSHPNGSLGQMILEMACFAALGVAVARALARAPWSQRLLGLVAWNGFHVGLFYLCLELSPHWTWQHSGLLGGAMLVPAVALLRASLALGPRRPEASEALRNSELAARASVLTDRQVLSLFLVVAPFVLMADPFGFGLMATLCVAIGLVMAWLTRRFVGTRASRAVAALLALAVPASGLIRASIEYREQRRYAEVLLAGAPALTLEDAEILEAAALATRQEDGDFERVDLVEEHAGVRQIAKKVLAPVASLREGASISLFVPLDGERYGRVFRSSWGGPHGDVIALFTENSYLEGYEFIFKLQADGKRRVVSWWTYAADTALRWKPPRFYAGWTLMDERGGVRALLFAETLPL